MLHKAEFFFLVPEYYSIICFRQFYFHPSSMGTHLGCFQFMNTVNTATINTGMQNIFKMVFYILKVNIWKKDS